MEDPLADDWLVLPTLPETLSKGRFSLLDLIGSGGVAQVFKAKDNESGEVVAIKLLEVRAFDKHHDTARFIAEAKVMAELEHPRVARVFGVGKEQGYYWFAMEYLPGGTLRELVKAQGPCEPLQALNLVHDILDGLVFVHERGIIHRDIKSRNVLLDGQGNAVIVDFGLAHHPDGSVPFKTRAEIGMGSVGYSAPEQRLDASSADERADVFAVGATLAWLVTGDRPDHLSLRDSQRPQTTDVDPNDVVGPILARACAYEPEARFATALEMREAVHIARQKLGYKQGFWAWVGALFGR